LPARFLGTLFRTFGGARFFGHCASRGTARFLGGGLSCKTRSKTSSSAALGGVDWLWCLGCVWVTPRFAGHRRFLMWTPPSQLTLWGHCPIGRHGEGQALNPVERYHFGRHARKERTVGRKHHRERTAGWPSSRWQLPRPPMGRLSPNNFSRTKTSDNFEGGGVDKFGQPGIPGIFSRGNLHGNTPNNIRRPGSPLTTYQG